MGYCDDAKLIQYDTYGTPYRRTHRKLRSLATTISRIIATVETALLHLLTPVVPSMSDA